MKKVNKSDAKKWNAFVNKMNNNMVIKVSSHAMIVKKKSSDDGNQVLMDFVKCFLGLFGLSVLITVILSCF